MRRYSGRSSGLSIRYMSVISAVTNMRDGSDTTLFSVIFTVLIAAFWCSTLTSIVSDIAAVRPSYSRSKGGFACSMYFLSALAV